MPTRYDCKCRVCGYGKEFLFGSFFAPFDSTGKMWEFKTFRCVKCGRPESRYVQRGGVRKRCRFCGAELAEIRSPDELKKLPCPGCSSQNLRIMAHCIF